MPLLVVQAFVNTYEADSGTDQLEDPAAARGWFADAGLLAPDEDPRATLTSAELELARRAREALRAMLRANGGGPSPGPDQLRVLAEVADAGSLRITVEPTGDIALDARAPSAVTRALIRILLVVRDAQRDGSWKRLKACGNAECEWAYFDRSHASRGRWCDMSGCGNRIKNRSLRARRR